MTRFKARRKNREKPQWRQYDDGKVLPSHFSGGSTDVIGHTPISIRRKDSVKSRFLVILDEMRATGKPYRYAQEYADAFTSKFKPDKPMTENNAAKQLSRMAMYGWVDNGIGENMGKWALKPDIDINDIEDLLARAKRIEESCRGD